MSDLQTNTYALSGGIEIPEGTDMDDYKTPGNYYCESNSTAQTLLNCPFNEAFTLKVDYSNGLNYPRQTLRSFTTGTIAIRYFNVDLSNWDKFVFLAPTTQS